MYFIISWDIPDASWDKANDAMLRCLEGHLTVKPLTTFYLVEIASTDEYRAMLKRLQETASEHRLNFLSVAVSSYSLWGGWLPLDKFPELRKITKSDPLG